MCKGSKLKSSDLPIDNLLVRAALLRAGGDDASANAKLPGIPRKSKLRMY